MNSAAQTEWAVAEVTVAGSDMNGVHLTLRPGATLSGVISADTLAPSSWKGTLVTVLPVRERTTTDMAGLTGGVASRQATVDEEGRFSVAGLEPYDYQVQVTFPAALASSGWTLANVRHQGRDLRDAPLTFANGSIDGAEIVLTTAVTELTGRLTADTGTPATDYFIVVFPDDRTLWHPASPRVRMLRPAADGTFSTRDLPAGAYRLAALIDVEAYELKDRAFLESIYDASISCTLAAGQATRQDVRIR